MITRDLRKQLEELQKFKEDFLSGAFPQPSPLGPNSISKHHIKAKQISGAMINVSNLEAVKSKTGSLTVDGTLNVSTGGRIVSGNQNLIDNGYMGTGGIGFIIEYNAGTPRLQIGNTSGNRLTWDGSTLNIVGTLTATVGTIGGWTIGATDLTADAGATGMASSGSYRFWTGNANPALAEFSVTSAGALTATGATISGAITATSGELQTLSVTNLLTLSGSGSIRWSGASNQITTSGIVTNTLDANGGTLGGLTVDGTLTVGAALVMTTGGIFRSGQTAFETGTGWYLEHNAGTPRLSIGSSSAGMSWNGTTFTIRSGTAAGTIDVGTGGVIKSGATSETATTGFWIAGGTTPVFRIGEPVSAGNDYLYWNGTTLVVAGRLEWGTSNFLSGDLIDVSLGTGATKFFSGHGAGTGEVVLQGLTSSTNNTANIQIQANSGTTSAYYQAQAGTVAQALSLISGNATYGVFIGINSSTTLANNFIEVGLADTAGTSYFEIEDSAAARLWAVNSAGAIYFKRNTTGTESTVPIHTGVATSGALPNPTKFLKIFETTGAVAYYIPVFTAVNAWAA